MGCEFCVTYTTRLEKDGDALDSARTAYGNSGSKEGLMPAVERARRDLDETQRLIDEHLSDPELHPERAVRPADDLSG